MREIKDTPITLILFILIGTTISLYNLYLLYLEFNISPDFNSPVQLSLYAIYLLLSVIVIFLIPLSFFLVKTVIRYYIISYFLFSTIWTIFMIIINRVVIQYYILFNINFLLLIFLFLSPIKIYFSDTSIQNFSDINEGYQYRKYTLYSKIVKLKNGRLQVIYFFSKRKPRDSTPANMPFGYKVVLNKNTGMPFLKKK